METTEDLTDEQLRAAQLDLEENGVVFFNSVLHAFQFMRFDGGTFRFDKEFGEPVRIERREDA